MAEETDGRIEDLYRRCDDNAVHVSSDTAGRPTVRC